MEATSHLLQMNAAKFKYDVKENLLIKIHYNDMMRDKRTKGWQIHKEVKPSQARFKIWGVNKY